MPLAPAVLEPLLCLAGIPGVGAGRLELLIRRFGSAELALSAPSALIAELPGFGPEMVRRMRAATGRSTRDWAERAVAALVECGAVALTPHDLQYPEAFRGLADPPFLLYARGDLRLAGRPAIAVVGTREPSPYGERVTSELAGELAQAGYLVVSGMARGIDAAAHRAALDGGGTTIGVLGHGIDRVYPAANRELYRQVAEQGLLLTEFPPLEAPRAGNFPRRNRLIAALSQGVLVVEMSTRSGAQHTVTYALEQGREVFAVPGPIGATTSAGTNQLIKDGARVVTSAADIVEELGGVGASRTSPAPGSRRRPPATPPAPVSFTGSPTAVRVLSLLAPEPVHVDQLAAEFPISVPDLLTALLELELAGAAEAMPGKQFRRR